MDSFVCFLFWVALLPLVLLQLFHPLFMRSVAQVRNTLAKVVSLAAVRTAASVSGGRTPCHSWYRYQLCLYGAYALCRTAMSLVVLVMVSCPSSLAMMNGLPLLMSPVHLLTSLPRNHSARQKCRVLL